MTVAKKAAAPKKASAPVKAGGAKNTKVTSESMAALAAQVMQDPRASKIQKSLAASALSQRDASRETSSEAEKKAAMVMRGTRYADVTRKLAASVMAQARKER
jgi:hypothetical protein